MLKEVLMMIHEAKSSSVAEVAKKLNKEKSTINNIIQHLVDMKYLIKNFDTAECSNCPVAGSKFFCSCASMNPNAETPVVRGYILSVKGLTLIKK